MTAYKVAINNKFNNLRIYTIKKSVKGNTNAISRKVDALIRKYILKRSTLPGDER